MSMCSLSLGFSRNTVQSMLEKAGLHSSSTMDSSVRLSASFHRTSEGGKCEPMSPLA